MTTETITLNKRNTTGTWTAEFDRHEVGRTLTPKQKSIFFQLGSEIGNNIARRMGYQPDANRAHAYALWCGDLINWKSLKAAKAVFITAQQEGSFLI